MWHLLATSSTCAQSVTQGQSCRRDKQSLTPRWRFINLMYGPQGYAMLSKLYKWGPRCVWFNQQQKLHSQFARPLHELFKQEWYQMTRVILQIILQYQSGSCQVSQRGSCSRFIFGNKQMMMGISTFVCFNSKFPILDSLFRACWYT